MADSRRAATARRSQNRTRTRQQASRSRSMYVEGNAVRRLQEVPDYYPERPPVRRRSARPVPPKDPVRVPKELSDRARRNRERAKGLNLGYMAIIVVAAALILFFSVRYLQLQTQITASMKNVANLEAQLTTIREDNDAYYSQVTSNVDLNEIKRIAIGRLGMKYPSEDQIMTYETEGKSYVRQYQDVPDTK